MTYLTYTECQILGQATFLVWALEIAAKAVWDPHSSFMLTHILGDRK